MRDLGTTTDLAVLDQQLVLQGQFVIDAGCGDLQLAKHLAQQGASVLAIDPDPVQAKKNRAADVIPNVGFAETGAESLPVEPASVDGVIFSYSLHHVPKSLYPAVFTEIFRVLKPEGFLYVIEPVAAGNLNEIVQLFHDERVVRREAQQALDTLARPRFASADDITFQCQLDYTGWEQFAKHYAGLSYNANYTEAQVRDEVVRERFETLGAPDKYSFQAPMRVAHFSGVSGTVA